MLMMHRPQGAARAYRSRLMGCPTPVKASPPTRPVTAHTPFLHKGLPASPSLTVSSRGLCTPSFEAPATTVIKEHLCNY